MFSSTDKALAQRLENGHAQCGRSFVLASGVAEAMAGGWAVYFGVGSPVTQALAIGMNGPVSEQELDRVEGFFHSRNSPAIIDLCTLADENLIASILKRGYLVQEITAVLARHLDAAELFTAPAGVEIRAVPSAEMTEWARLVMEGFTGNADVPDEMSAMMSATHPTRSAFFFFHDGKAFGGAAMETHDGLATLYGDATIEAGRGRGLQVASIQHRLREAARMGCDLASASVVPGGISHRNYERCGFQLVYTRIMFSLKQKMLPESPVRLSGSEA
jgi:GNAT superfamily N-acetyltransferase